MSEDEAVRELRDWARREGLQDPGAEA
jgi:hypothetical protein